MSKTIVFVLLAFSYGYGNMGTITKVDEFPTRGSCRSFVEEIKTQLSLAATYTKYICVRKEVVEND